MTELSYAIIGTGAIGGFFGGRLAHAGIESHFLLRSDYEHVLKNGLVIQSKDGDFALPRINAYHDATEMPRCDVAVVALKTMQNHILRDILPHVMNDDGVVVLLQNGLGIEAPVAKIVGDQRVYVGSCYVLAEKTAPGAILHQDRGTIDLGWFKPEHSPGGINEIMRNIAADFKKSGTQVSLTDDLLFVQWRKLIWNIPFNGLSVTMNALPHEILADPAGERRAEGLMQEVVTAAAAYNRHIPQDFVKTMLDYTRTMPPFHTSTKVDFDRGRPLEIDAIFANPIKAAAARSVDMPLSQELLEELNECHLQSKSRGNAFSRL